MADFRDERPRWRRWLLGGRDSWRRIVLTGVAGGLVLAVAAALIAAVVNDSGSDPLDDSEPTAIAPVAGPDGDVPQEPVATEPPVIEEPTVGPAATEPPSPTEPPATEAPPPTDPPPTEPPPPTDPPIVPTLPIGNPEQ